MSVDQEQIDKDDSVDSPLTAVGDVIGVLVSDIPAPIRKSAIKAFSQLCTAAIEYPMALIECVIEERRAESRARVKLIDVSASQIAEQMQIKPEYVHAAATKFTHRIIRERVNVDKIAKIAADNLRSEKFLDSNEQEKPLVSDDWLNAFESEAVKMSSEQMQLLFGKILAGEIRRPSSYSIKTVKLMAQLDNHAAALFRLLCSLSVSLRVPDSNIILDARVVSMGHAGANSLQAYGLGFDALNILHEYGLIISDYNSYMDYRMALFKERPIVLPMTYQKASWAFVSKSSSPVLNEFQIVGVGFSRSGKELLSIVDIEPNEQYTTALKNFFDNQGIVMTRVG